MTIPHEWEKEQQVAAQAARTAGDILRRKFGHIRHVEKKGEIDLVTEADLEAETAVLDIIQRRFPHDAVLSEEAGANGGSPERTWIIDPLDGTTNFAHGFPFFGVSIAFEFEGTVVLGIVYNPVMEEYFEAIRTAGAFLNRRSITVSRVQTMGEALLATGFPYDVRETHREVMDLFTKMLVRAQGLRRPGAAAIDLCYVAAGKFDGFWEQGLKPWDTAAGDLIVEEAGGRVSTFDGEPHTHDSKSIVAANPYIHDAMIAILNSGHSGTGPGPRH